MIYHVKRRKNKNENSISKDDFVSFDKLDIESILFLSKILFSIEKRYWSIELEMIVLIWSIRKLRIMIVNFDLSTIMYIDHVVNTTIVKQTKFTFSSVDKLNLKLIRASIYLSQFRLKIFHRIDKFNVVFDAFSRLFTNRHSVSNTTIDSFDIESYHAFFESSKNDVIYVYNEFLLVMFDDFRKQFFVDYKNDKTWKSIYDMLIKLQDRFDKKRFVDTSSSSIESSSSTKSSSSAKRNQTRMTDTFVESTVTFSDTTEIKKEVFNDIDFRLIDDLIYYVKDNNSSRLCVFVNFEQNVMKLIHDENSHVEHHRIYVRIVKFVYIRHLSRKLTVYIRHCSFCQLNQTKRHQSYDELMSLSTSCQSFHTIVMNFILALSRRIRENRKYDCALTIICKFSRRLIIVSNKMIWSIEQWIDVVFVRLQIANWEISTVIISDRNRKFLSDFWTALLKRLKINLLMNTAYHSQIDDLSKRFNQIVEMTLRFLITENSNIDWIKILSTLQFRSNNSLNVVIELTFNEIIYDFKVREVMTVVVFSFQQIIDDNLFIVIFDIKSKFETNRFQYQKKVDDVTSYVNVKIKIMYDSRHQFLLFNSNDKTFLRLHRDYNLFDNSRFKLSNQRCDSFIVKRRINRLAYELDISARWKIHSVVFVIQLESVSNKNIDSYNRSKSNYLDEMKVESLFNIVYWKFYEVEKLIDKRTRKFDRIFVIQYLVRWREYDFEYDEWRSIIIFDNVMNLVEVYERANSSNISKSMLSISSKQSVKKTFNVKTISAAQTSSIKMTSIKNLSKSTRRRERLRKTLTIQHVDAFIEMIY